MSDPLTRARLAELPRYPLLLGPTPLEPFPGRLPGLEGRLWLKRDDLTGFALGGNKSRKLEFTMADALAKGATALVTASGIQSNHVRQTAAAAARAGLAFHAVVTPALERYPRTHVSSGNMLLDMMFGTIFHLAPSEADSDAVIERVVAELKRRGERPYVIPLGASDGIGSLGYVAAALELLDQCEALDIRPRGIFLPTGSGGTHGGLLAGLRLAGCDVPVIGLSVSEPAPAKVAKVRASADGVATVLQLAGRVSPEDIVVSDRFAGPGYAQPTAGADRWVAALARHHGLLLDPVYTGKAFDGMMTLLGEGLDSAEADFVFLHTGGLPVLFADPAQFATVPRDAPALEPLYRGAPAV